MEYSHILDLIDSYLDILHQARKILVQDQVPRGTRPPSTKKRRAMRSKTLLLTKSDFSAPQPEGREIAFAPKEHSRSSASHGTSQRQISVSVHPAQSGDVSLKPVIVSAKQARLQASQRLAAGRADPTHPNSRDDGAFSADALRRRWLRK